MINIMNTARSPNYVERLMDSTYCLCPEGWHAWTPRPTEAVLLNCIPVILSDRVQLPFEEHIDWDQFAVRVRPDQVSELKKLLMAIDHAEVVRRRQAMERVWQHFVYDEQLGGIASQSILDRLSTRRTRNSIHRKWLEN
jgi:Exostosin family